MLNTQTNPDPEAIKRPPQTVAGSTTTSEDHVILSKRDAHTLLETLNDAVTVGVMLNFKNARGYDLDHVLSEHNFTTLVERLDDCADMILGAQERDAPVRPIPEYFVILNEVGVCIGGFDTRSEAEAYSAQLKVRTTVFPASEVLG